MRRFCPRLCLFLCLFFSSHFGLAQNSFSLITWNLENFGKAKSENSLRVIAQTVHLYDVLAIQEVVGSSGGKEAVQRLTAMLNRDFPRGNWKSVCSQETSGSPAQSERYAFIWNDRNLHLVGNPWLDQHFAAEIVREPFMGTFAAGKDTFTLVSFHAVPKKRQPEREIKYLKYFPAFYPKLNLLFLGDFNTPQSHNVFFPLKKMGYLPVLTGQKTTLKMKCVGGQCLASEYDNVFYHPGQIVKIKTGIIPFYAGFPGLVVARKVSDHVPVFFEFKVK